MTYYSGIFSVHSYCGIAEKLSGKYRPILFIYIYISTRVPHIGENPDSVGYCLQNIMFQYRPMCR